MRTSQENDSSQRRNDEVILIDGHARAGDVWAFKWLDRYHHLLLLEVREVSGVYPQPIYVHLCVVFQQSHASLPKATTGLDFRRIYRIQSRPRNSLLYLAVTDFQRHVAMSRELDDRFDAYSQVRMHHLGQTSIAGNFHPPIVVPTSMFPLECVHDSAGVQLSPVSARFSYIFGRLSADLAWRNEKLQDVQSRYFPHWRDDVIPGVLVKVEKLFTELDSVSEPKAFVRLLKATVGKLNTLEARERFVGTLEAEDLVSALSRLMAGRISIDAGMAIIDQHRDW